MALDYKQHGCQYCKKKYHVCSSCGVEDYLYYFCSENCVNKAGYSICPYCNGWDCCYDPEDTDEYNEDRNPLCEHGVAKRRS